MASSADSKLDSRQRLLAAARELLWANSYGAVSVDDMCARAEVNKGSFYHHFASKLDLAKAAFEAHWADIQPHFDAIFSAQVPPLERFTRYVAAVEVLQGGKKQEIGRVLGCPYTSLGCEAAPDAGLRELAQLNFARTARYFAAAIRDAQREGVVAAELDAEQLAAQIHALVAGAMAQARIADSLAPLTHLASGIRRLLGVVA